MACVSPATVSQTFTRGPTTAVVTMTHCDGSGFIYLSVDFVPKSIGASIEVKGLIRVDGESGYNFTTGTVIFNDDGSVTNFGDVSNGVRFKQPKHNMTRPHTGILSCSFRR